MAGTAINMSLTIRSTDMDYLRRELGATPELMQRSLKLAINAALRVGQKQITTGVQKVTTIKDQTRIYKDIIVKKATNADPRASVTFYARGIGALHFDHVVLKRYGASYRPNPGGTDLSFPGGFKAIGANGNEHIFFRIRGTMHHVGSKAHHKPNIGRNMEKLKSVLGPRLGKILSLHPEIEQKASSKAARTLHNRLFSQIDRSLNRKKTERPDYAPEYYA